jgi:hypothetical protein
MKRSHGFTLAFVAALMAMPLQSAAQAPTDRWTFSLQPYLWLPGVDADLRYGPPPPGGSSANVKVSEGDFLESINFAFLLQGEARKGRWLIASDFIYLDMGSENSEVRSVDFNPGPGPINISTSQLNAGTQTSLDAVVWTLLGGYNVAQDPAVTLDLIAGVRYAGVDTHTNWNLTAVVTGPAGAQTFARTGSVERKVNLWDAIIGARGRFKLGDGNWFMPYHIDVGAGDSDLTWQGALGVGYAFKWGELALTYRYLYYEQGDDELIQKLKLGGFAFGANFRF